METKTQRDGAAEDGGMRMKMKRGWGLLGTEEQLDV